MDCHIVIILPDGRAFNKVCCPVAENKACWGRMSTQQALESIFIDF